MLHYLLEVTKIDGLINIEVHLYDDVIMTCKYSAQELKNVEQMPNLVRAMKNNQNFDICFTETDTLSYNADKELFHFESKNMKVPINLFNCDNNKRKFQFMNELEKLYTYTERQ